MVLALSQHRLADVPNRRRLPKVLSSSTVTVQIGTILPPLIVAVVIEQHGSKYWGGRLFFQGLFSGTPRVEIGQTGLSRRCENPCKSRIPDRAHRFGS